MAGTKRRGPARPKEDSETVNLTLRISKRVYEEIRADAELSGRSISAQAEKRASYREPSTSDVGRMIDLVLQAIETRTGKSWSEDYDIQLQARAAIEFVLNALFGDSEVNSLVNKAALLVLHDMKSTNDKSYAPGLFDRMLNQIEQATKGRAIASDLLGSPPGKALFS